MTTFETKDVLIAEDLALEELWEKIDNDTKLDILLEREKQWELDHEDKMIRHEFTSQNDDILAYDNQGELDFN